MIPEIKNKPFSSVNPVVKTQINLSDVLSETSPGPKQHSALAPVVLQRPEAVLRLIRG